MNHTRHPTLDTLPPLQPDTAASAHCASNQHADIPNTPTVPASPSSGGGASVPASRDGGASVPASRDGGASVPASRPLDTRHPPLLTLGSWLDHHLMNIVLPTDTAEP